jgi:predicted CoA-binding protein
MHFSENNIAVVGVSLNKEKYGYKIFKDLKKNGYKVYGVNPRIDKFEDGTKIYKKLSEIPVKIDIVITVVPPQSSEKIVDECIELGIKNIWFQPGSESKTAIEKSQKNGIKTTTACFMVHNKIW